MVVATMLRIEEDFLTRNCQERSNILPKHLNVVHVWISPVALGNIQKVHQCIVLGIGVTMSDFDGCFIFLIGNLASIKHWFKSSTVGSCHLVDALFFKLIFLAISLVPHHIDEVEHCTIVEENEVLSGVIQQPICWHWKVTAQNKTHLSVWVSWHPFPLD